MRYEQVMAAVCGVPWAILPDKLSEIMAVLAHRVAGHVFTPEEIEARIGTRGAGVSTQGRGVGVLPIRGTIAHRMGSMDESSGGVSTERLSGMLSEMMADETLGTILLDVDSPGGAVTGVSEFAAQVFAARGKGTKRIVALVNGMAASAAYWIASQADEIVSIPSGMTGSIGVFTAHEDLSAKLEKEGVTVSVISAGKHKVDGHPFAPLSDEHRAFMQARVNDAYGQFVKDVARGRGVSASDVRGGYGEGRALTAKDALAAGLIDRIDTVEGTLSKLLSGRSSGLKAEAADVVVALDETVSVVAPATVDEARRLEMF